MSNNRDSLGDRMKSLENRLDLQLMSNLPVIARLDGKGFHNFTKGMERPFDLGFSELMRTTASYLAEKYHATLAYVQSDEMTLVWKIPPNPLTEFMFGGRIAKCCSVLAAECSVYFNYRKNDFITSKQVDWPLAVFDARIWNVPNESEASNCLIWREQDATRNSIQMAGRAYFSHTELNKKSCNEIQEMLFQQKQINWNDYPWFFKRGCYIRKHFETRLINNEPVDRTIYKEEVDLPPLTKLTNRERFIFHGQPPILREETANVGPETTL